MVRTFMNVIGIVLVVLGVLGVLGVLMPSDTAIHFVVGIVRLSRLQACASAEQRRHRSVVTSTTTARDRGPASSGAASFSFVERCMFW